MPDRNPPLTAEHLTAVLARIATYCRMPQCGPDCPSKSAQHALGDVRPDRTTTDPREIHTHLVANFGETGAETFIRSIRIYQEQRLTTREREHNADRAEIEDLRRQLETARAELREAQAEAAPTSPWQQATDGLNALCEAGVPFWIEPDGHITTADGDHHISWDRATERWRLVYDAGEHDDA